MADTNGPISARDVASGLPAMAIAVLAGAACVAVAGPTFGAFLASLVMGVAIAPPLVFAQTLLRRRIIALCGVIDGLAVAWLWVVLTSPAGLLQWLQCYVMLAGLLAATAGLACALERLRVPTGLACGLAVVLALTWLSWPVWTAPYLMGARFDGLRNAMVAAHPIFALNGVFLGTFQPWPAYTLAYAMTNLPYYEMPASVWPCVAVHGVIGIAGFLAVRREARGAPLSATALRG